MADVPPRRSQSERAVETRSGRAASATLPQLRTFDGTERFRKHAAVRFRHAVRGEWDLMDALQQERPPTQGFGNSSSSQLLPAIAGASTISSLDHSTLSIADIEDGKIEIISPSIPRGRSVTKTPPDDGKTDLWSEAVQGLDRRQKQNSWVDSHRKTISNWSKAGLSPCSDEEFYPLRTDPSGFSKFGSLPKTASEPILRKPADRSKSDAEAKEEASGALRSASASLLPPHASLSSEQVAAKNARKTAEVVREHATAMRALPDLNQRFGEASVQLLKALSQGPPAEAPNARGDRDPPVPTQTAQHKCELCRGWHGVTVPCSM